MLYTQNGIWKIEIKLMVKNNAQYIQHNVEPKKGEIFEYIEYTKYRP